MLISFPGTLFFTLSMAVPTHLLDLSLITTFLERSLYCPAIVYLKFWFFSFLKCLSHFVIVLFIGLLISCDYTARTKVP